MVSGLFEKKWDAIPPHPAPPPALFVYVMATVFHFLISFHYRFAVFSNLLAVIAFSVQVTHLL
jgi:hypothetical protein